MRSLMRSQFHGEAPLLLSSPFVTAVGFQGDPSDLLCTDSLNRSHQKSTSDTLGYSQSCPFHIPTSLTAHLKSRTTEVMQVLIATDGALESIPLPTAAGPPISTGVVAMEITTPRGQPVHVKDLQPEQAIRVALHSKCPLEPASGGDAGNGTCLTVTLPREQLDFTVKAPDELDENAGLYLSLTFSLAPGTVAVSPLTCAVYIFISSHKTLLLKVSYWLGSICQTLNTQHLPQTTLSRKCFYLF